jgi:L-threonylcarbamoyladenylate synthase
MSSPLVAIKPVIALEETANIMLNKKMKKLPVIDGNRMVGMLSLTDSAKCARNKNLGSSRGQKRNAEKPQENRELLHSLTGARTASHLRTRPRIAIRNAMKKTLLLRVNPQNPCNADIQIAATIIKRGGLVAFPTETVYGLGANALNPDAVRTLFEAKKRPLDNPPIVHVASVTDVYKLAKNVPEKAKLLMKKFWSGPLTLILERSEAVPDVTVAGLSTVAVRMPKNNVALALIRESECPIAAPSANLAGKPSPTTAQHVFDDLNGRIDVILDGGPTHIGVESTVLDLSVDPPQVLRPGGVPFETLTEALGDVRLHSFATAEQEVAVGEARSPGMRHKHYAPKARLVLVEGSVPAVAEKVKSLVAACKRDDSRVGVLATDETASRYEADVVKSLGSRFNVEAIAQNLFKLLREFDAENVDVIIAESVPAEGLGLAVMNRLRKASGYNIVKTDE